MADGAGPSQPSCSAVSAVPAAAHAGTAAWSTPVAGDSVLCVRLSHDCAAETCANMACPFCKHAAVRPCPTPAPLRVREVFPVRTPLTAFCGQPVLATLCRQDASGEAEALSPQDLKAAAQAGGCFVVCSAAEGPLDADFHGNVDRYWETLHCAGGARPNFALSVVGGAGAAAAGEVATFPLAPDRTTPLCGLTFPRSSVASAAVGGQQERAVLLVRFAAGGGALDRHVAGAASGPFKVVSENGMRTAAPRVLWLTDQVDRVKHIAHSGGAGRADLLNGRGIYTVAQLREAALESGRGAAADLQRAIDLNDSNWNEVLEQLTSAREADSRMVAYYSNLEGTLCTPDGVPPELSDVLRALVERKVSRTVGLRISVAAAYARHCGVPSFPPNAAAGYTVRVAAGCEDKEGLEQVVPAPSEPSQAFQMLTARLRALALQAWREHGHLERGCGWHFLLGPGRAPATALESLGGDAFETDASRRPVDTAVRHVEVEL